MVKKPRRAPNAGITHMLPLKSQLLGHLANVVLLRCRQRCDVLLSPLPPLPRAPPDAQLQF